jgi:hypothetical protein
MNNERLNYLKQYFQNQEQVTVELPPVICYVGKMKKITRFNGTRLGDVDFIDGKATISRDRLHLLQAWYPDLIVHDATTTTTKGAK